MTTTYRLPGGAGARLTNPGVPFLPHYRVLYLLGEEKPEKRDEAELLTLGQRLARRLGEEALGDPEAFSVLFNGARTRRFARAHVHLLPSGSVTGKRWALLFLSLKRLLRLVRSLGARPLRVLHELRVGLRSRFARWRLARVGLEPPLLPTRGEIDELAAAFEAAWKGVGCAGPPDATFDELVRRYGEPHRHYHSLHHVLALTRGLERHPGPVHDRDTLVLAIFFHDAVQVPGRDDDEAASARLARSMLERSGIDPSRLEAIETLVRATRHRGAPPPGDATLIVDLDLAILGSVPETYDAYNRAVRAEYAWVSQRRWRRRRRQLLTTWLARPALFQTPDHRARLESRARANLQRELAALG